MQLCAENAYYEDETLNGEFRIITDSHILKNTFMVRWLCEALENDVIVSNNDELEYHFLLQ